MIEQFKQELELRKKGCGKVVTFHRCGDEFTKVAKNRKYDKFN